MRRAAKHLVGEATEPSAQSRRIPSEQYDLDVEAFDFLVPLLWSAVISARARPRLSYLEHASSVMIYFYCVHRMWSLRDDTETGPHARFGKGNCHALLHSSVL
jgi:hypothetical protein